MAAIETDIRVEGGENLKRQFQRLERSAKRKTLRNIFRRAGRPVITQARRNLTENRLTGELAKGIAQTVGAEEFATRVTVSIGMRRKVFYGRFLELGTAFVAAKPWLVPALISQRVKILSIISVGFKKEFLKIARTGGK